MGNSVQSPRIDMRQVVLFSKLVASLQIGTPLNFYSIVDKNGNTSVLDDQYPPLESRWAVDFFFLVGIHQYGFWHGETKYDGPLIGTLSGRSVKGSDLLWKLLLRAFKETPVPLSGSWLTGLKRKRWNEIMTDDSGVVHLLANKERFDLTREFGDWCAKKTPPADSGSGFLRELLSSGTLTPAELLLSELTDSRTGAPGYREDPLKKKALLLMLSLVNRPEQFLIPEEDFVWDPVVDYHLVRLALRLGLVILPSSWLEENRQRSFTSPLREFAVRKAVQKAVRFVIEKSGRTMAEIDNLMWSAWRYCPEVETPDCAKCSLRVVCAKKIDLFQPVLRTTLY